VELVIPVDGAELPATLTLPGESVRAAVVVLHGAEAGQRSYFLYEHLAHLLERAGVAVLRYDRRQSTDRHDVPLRTQASDALAALRQLREIVNPAPVGLWGFSQGAWAAPLAAATDPDSVGFLICVSCCGVSPAEQMRAGCAKQLRKHGYNESDIAELTAEVVPSSVELRWRSELSGVGSTRLDPGIALPALAGRGHASPPPL